MTTVFVGLGILGISVICVALTLLLRGDGSKEQKLMQYFLIGTLVQNVGYILELTAPTLEAALVSVKVQYLGSLIVPITYCYFMFSYCFVKAPVKLFKFIRLADFVILGLVFTCDHHTLFYRSAEWMQTAQGHHYLNLEYGPGYWLFMVCGTIIPYSLSLFSLIHVCLKKPDYAADRKYLLILGLSFLPVVVLCSYVLKLFSVYDLTPFVLGIILSCVVILIWSRKVYDFGSLAAAIFHDLSPGAVGKHIGELDGFPQSMLDEDTREEFNLNGCFYQGHVQQIPDKYDEIKGYVILILDVTETRNYIEEIKQVREQAEQYVPRNTHADERDCRLERYHYGGEHRQEGIWLCLRHQIFLPQSAGADQ